MCYNAVCRSMSVLVCLVRLSTPLCKIPSMHITNSYPKRRECRAPRTNLKTIMPSCQELAQKIEHVSKIKFYIK